MAKTATSPAFRPKKLLRPLRKAGVRHVFHPGASREEIVSRVAELAGEARIAKSEEALA